MKIEDVNTLHDLKMKVAELEAGFLETVYTMRTTMLELGSHSKLVKRTYEINKYIEYEKRRDKGKTIYPTSIEKPIIPDLKEEYIYIVMSNNGSSELPWAFFDSEKKAIDCINKHSSSMSKIKIKHPSIITLKINDVDGLCYHRNVRVDISEQKQTNEDSWGVGYDT